MILWTFCMSYTIYSSNASVKNIIKRWGGFMRKKADSMNNISFSEKEYNKDGK